MTKEDRELLLKKDLCARFPYGVKLEVKYQEGAWMLFAIYYAWSKIYAIGDGGYPIESNFADCKPYLFPLSTISNETLEKISAFVDAQTSHVIMEFFNSHHIDYRGLIEKGLAIDATGLNIY